jgi:hypothetical protein
LNTNISFRETDDDDLILRTLKELADELCGDSMFTLWVKPVLLTQVSCTAQDADTWVTAQALIRSRLNFFTVSAEMVGASSTRLHAHMCMHKHSFAHLFSQIIHSTHANTLPATNGDMHFMFLLSVIAHACNRRVVRRRRYSTWKCLMQEHSAWKTIVRLRTRKEHTLQSHSNSRITLQL